MRFKTLFDRFFNESKDPRTARRKPRFTRLLVLEHLEDRCLLSVGINEFGYLTPNSHPQGITTGPDERMSDGIAISGAYAFQLLLDYFGAVSASALPYSGAEPA